MISDEDISLDNSIEFQGLVQQIKCNNYLMPLYEAVINSIQSIQINKIKNPTNLQLQKMLQKCYHYSY